MHQKKKIDIFHAVWPLETLWLLKEQYSMSLRLLYVNVSIMAG